MYLEYGAMRSRMVLGRNIWDSLKTGDMAGLVPWRGVARDIENTIDIDSLLEHKTSIAVLPFTDRKGKSNQAHFCAGVAEEILNTLNRVADLRVVPRQTSFNFSSDDEAGTAGTKLGVDTLLVGWILNTAGGLQLKVRLIDTRTGRELWSQRFDRAAGDIMGIQQVITEKVARVLGLSLTDNLPAGQLPVDPRAYDFFLRGLSYFSRHTTQDIVYARQMLKQAIEIEPDYGRAWAGVAYTHGFEYMYFNASNVNLAEVQRTSARALKLAPDLVQSHITSGIAHCMNHRYRKTQKAFSRAIRLDPGNFHAWYFFGRAKVHEGDLAHALKLFDCASRVRPEDFQSVLLQAQLYISRDEQDKAIEVTRKGIKRVRFALDLNPADNRALNMGAFALLRLGESQEAEQWMMRSLQNAPMDSIIQYNGACFYSLAGDVEQALDCLENCLVKVGSINREWLVHDSDMDNIRHHPKFEEIIRTFPG